MNGHMTYLDSQAQRALPGAARQSFITAIVGNIPNVSVKKGIDNYVDYIEHQMSECCLASADILTQILGPRDNGIGINELLEATVTVAKILNDLSSKSSLNDIAENLLAHFQTTGPTETREEFLRSARQLVFASIGWISMLYIPVPDLSGAAFGILEPAATVPLRQSLHHLSNSWKRPVGAMFRTMGVLPISCPVVPPVHKGSQVTGKPLSVSNLCYWSLRKTGKLSIAWIDSMTDHCAFDATRKELKLFRFPAFCVQTYGGHPGVRVLSRYA